MQALDLMSAGLKSLSGVGSNGRAPIEGYGDNNNGTTHVSRSLRSA
jgi:hypothetical protein